jgi:hypothetical protein
MEAAEVVVEEPFLVELKHIGINRESVCLKDFLEVYIGYILV